MKATNKSKSLAQFVLSKSATIQKAQACVFKLSRESGVYEKERIGDFRILTSYMQPLKRN